MAESKSITLYDCLIITSIDHAGFDVLHHEEGKPGKLIGWRSTEEGAKLLALEYQLAIAKDKLNDVREAVDYLDAREYKPNHEKYADAHKENSRVAVVGYERGLVVAVEEIKRALSKNDRS